MQPVCIQCHATSFSEPSQPTTPLSTDTKQLARYQEKILQHEKTIAHLQNKLEVARKPAVSVKGKGNEADDLIQKLQSDIQQNKLNFQSQFERLKQQYAAREEKCKNYVQQLQAQVAQLSSTEQSPAETSSAHLMAKISRQAKLIEQLQTEISTPSNPRRSVPFSSPATSRVQRNLNSALESSRRWLAEDYDSSDGGETGRPTASLPRSNVYNVPKEIVKLEANLDIAHTENTALASKLEATRRALDDLRASEAVAKERHLRELDSARSDTSTAIVALRKDLEHSQRDCDRLQTDRDRLTRLCEQLRTKVQEQMGIENRVNALQKELALTTQQCRAHEHANASLRRKLQIADSLSTQLLAEVDHVRAAEHHKALRKLEEDDARTTSKDEWKQLRGEVSKLMVEQHSLKDTISKTSSKLEERMLHTASLGGTVSFPTATAGNASFGHTHAPLRAHENILSPPPPLLHSHPHEMAAPPPSTHHDIPESRLHPHYHDTSGHMPYLHPPGIPDSLLHHHHHDTPASAPHQHQHHHHHHASPTHDHQHYETAAHAVRYHHNTPSSPAHYHHDTPTHPHTLTHQHQPQEPPQFATPSQHHGTNSHPTAPSATHFTSPPHHHSIAGVAGTPTLTHVASPAQTHSIAGVASHTLFATPTHQQHARSLPTTPSATHLGSPTRPHSTNSGTHALSTNTAPQPHSTNSATHALHSLAATHCTQPHHSTAATVLPLTPAMATPFATPTTPSHAAGTPFVPPQHPQHPQHPQQLHNPACYLTPTHKPAADSAAGTSMHTGSTVSQPQPAFSLASAPAGTSMHTGSTVSQPQPDSSLAPPHQPPLASAAAGTPVHTGSTASPAAPSLLYGNVSPSHDSYLPPPRQGSQGDFASTSLYELSALPDTLELQCQVEDLSRRLEAAEATLATTQRPLSNDAVFD